MAVLKRKDFCKWQSSMEIPNTSLCHAVREMETGLIDAQIGNGLFKKRIARSGSGKSAGYRFLISAQIGTRYVFLHGFQKSCKDNISLKEKRALQFAGKVFLGLSQASLEMAIEAGVLTEVDCEQNH